MAENFSAIICFLRSIMKKKKDFIGFVAFALMCVVAISVLFFALNSKSVSESDVVATVNGYEICAGELDLIMSMQKGYIIDEYGEDFDEIDQNFWDAEIGDTTPIKELRKSALDTLVRYKIEQAVAVKNGILTKEQTSYENFLSSLNRENQSRSQALANGEKIYGVTSYTKSSYFEYVYNNLAIKNREILGKTGNELYATDKQLFDWYESVKRDKYPKTDTYKLDVYRISLQNTSQEQAEKILENVKKDLDKGKDYILNNYKMVEFLELDVDDSNSSEIQKTYNSLFVQLENLEVGDKSEIMTEQGFCSIAVCTYRKDGGYKSFSVYKKSMYAEFIEVKYEAYIDELVAKATVKTTDKFNYIYLDN